LPLIIASILLMRPLLVAGALQFATLCTATCKDTIAKAARNLAAFCLATRATLSLG